MGHIRYTLSSQMLQVVTQGSLRWTSTLRKRVSLSYWRHNCDRRIVEENDTHCRLSNNWWAGSNKLQPLHLFRCCVIISFAIQDWALLRSFYWNLTDTLVARYDACFFIVFPSAETNLSRIGGRDWICVNVYSMTWYDPHQLASQLARNDPRPWTSHAECSSRHKNRSRRKLRAGSIHSCLTGMFHISLVFPLRKRYSSPHAHCTRIIWSATQQHRDDGVWTTEYKKKQQHSCIRQHVHKHGEEDGWAGI